MVRKATNNKPIEETLGEIVHRLKGLEKGQQSIKSHLWREEKQPSAPSDDKQNEIIRQEAITYINSVVMPDIEAHKAESGEMSAQGLGDWIVAQIAKPVAEYLKSQALYYVGEALSELKRKAIPYAVAVADWILEKLEDFIVNKCQEANEEQREQFKEAIKEKFPNSRLLEKLN